ncbi:TPA: hypothetical protein ACH3X1_015089 [Trebouxia sp. C0004]
MSTRYGKLSSSTSPVQAGTSGRSTLDGDDDWLHGHLGSDHHGPHLTTDSLLDPATGTLPYLYGHSGLTCSRFDDTLPFLYSHALYPDFAGNGHAPDQHNWAHAFHERADQATATSPLRRPLRSTSAGFMMSSFEVGDYEGIKAEPGLDGGLGLPFAALEDTSLAALHHLHQVQQGFSMPAGQLMGLDDHPLPHGQGLAHTTDRPLFQGSTLAGHHTDLVNASPPHYDVASEACEGEQHLLLQHGCLGREASETRLHWHIPAVPSHSHPQGPFCYPHPAIMQSALQHAFGAVQATSEQQSDDSGGMYTSSTGYSHSPQLSPRAKCSVRTVRTLHASPPRHGDIHQGMATHSGGSLPKLLAGSPEGADTPDHQQDLPARCRGQEEDVRQRAACELYGLRRLRASPRWALEAAEMSDDSRSAGEEAESAESGSDTESMSWARRPVTGSRASTRRRRRVRTSTGDATCSSQFRGVSKHRLTQRWEASLWLEGRQLYLGGFQTEPDAARAYDIAALSCKGPHVLTNYPEESYAQELQETAGCSTDEMIAYVRRKSAAFSRGRSKYRGVSGQAGRWEARIGAYCGRKNVSFGVHEEEESAARQYDRALLIEKGRAAKTNFPLPDYEKESKEFEEFVVERCGDLTCPAAMEMIAKWVLPLSANTASGGPQPVVPKKKGRGGRPRSHAACIILADDLHRAIKRT